MAQHELEQRVVARRQRAALVRQHLERGAGLEGRQRDQAGAGDERDQERERRAGDVEERPAVEVAIVGPDPQAQAHGPGVAQHVVVGEHDCLRIGGRAGRELDEQEVAGFHLGGEAIEHGVRHAGPECEEVIQASSGSRDFLPDDDDVTQQRQHFAGERAVDGGLRRAQERQEVDVEKAVGDEQRLDVGLREAERKLRRLEARIDRHGDRADHGGGVEQRHPGLVVAQRMPTKSPRLTPSACIALAARRTAWC